MKTKYFAFFILVVFISIYSCEKETINPDLETFCRVKPAGWDCEIIQSDFDANDFPKNAGTPLAVVKYKNLNREFTAFSHTILNPSLVINLYPIEQKNDLADFIQSQQIFSWCIPVYYGETRDYFIVTSPCFINGGVFTEEANSAIKDLHQSLAGILTKINQDITEN